MKSKLDVFLPTAKEIEEMSQHDFDFWVSTAPQVLRKRAKQRDPLFQLKERIINVLNDMDLREETKELHILSDIERYHLDRQFNN